MICKRIACFCLALAAALTCGCAQEPRTSDSLPVNNDKIVVGFSMATLLEDRWIRDRDIFLALAGQAGLEVIVKNANMDPDVQYEQVIEMLDQGIDVLLLAPSDRNENVKCVEAAKQRGVPVISYDRLVCDANVDVYLSFDNMMVGRLMAESLLSEVPEGGYVLVNGSPDDYNSTMIREGYMAVLQSRIAAGRIKILDETWVDNWVRESAFSFASTAAKTFDDEIDAIICGNDSLAWGVIDALNEAQISEQVAIVGMDADLVACRRIVSGQQLMTVYKPITDLVASAVELCTQLAGGGKTFAEETINDGTYDVPYVAIGVIAVTKDNMDETVIQDGFHLREDIYSQTPGE